MEEGFSLFGLSKNLLTMLLLAGMMALAGCRVVSEPAELMVYQSKASSPQTSLGGPDPAMTGSTGTRSDTGSTQASARIICEIKGQIRQPGVYDLPAGSRVHDLVSLAGGPSSRGSLDLVNQARRLEDGEAVLIPAIGVTKEEYEAMTLGKPPVEESPSSGSTGPTPLINVNTADQVLLETVPNIGAVTAQNIIDYRSAHGPFLMLEDLKKVNRIGDKTFEKIKPYLTLTP